MARKFKPLCYPNGLSTDAPTGNLADFGRPDPTAYAEYFTDFMRYAAAEWTITNTTGTVTVARASLKGGCITATNSATASASNTIINAVSSVGGAFTVQPYVSGGAQGERLFFAARFKVGDLATVAGLGLYKYDTTAGLAPADGLFFLSTVTTGAVVLKAINSAASTTTSSTVATLVADTFIELAFVYEPNEVYKDGSSRGPVKVYVNGSEVLSIPSANCPASAVVLTPGFAVFGNAKVLTVDYLFAAQERR